MLSFGGPQSATVRVPLAFERGQTVAVRRVSSPHEQSPPVAGGPRRRRARVAAVVPRVHSPRMRTSSAPTVCRPWDRRVCLSPLIGNAGRTASPRRSGPVPPRWQSAHRTYRLSCDEDGSVTTPREARERRQPSEQQFLPFASQYLVGSVVATEFRDDNEGCLSVLEIRERSEQLVVLERRERPDDTNTTEGAIRRCEFDYGAGLSVCARVDPVCVAARA